MIASRLAAIVLLAGCAGPSLSVEVGTAPDTGDRFVAVRGLDRTELNRLATTDALRVFVDEDGAGADGTGVDHDGGDRPPVLGRTRVRDGALEFVPRFPLQAGLRYRAVFEHRGGRREHRFAIAPEPSGPRPEVVAVFPMAAEQPENTLRFYLQFSAPMRQGDVYRYLRLERDDGVAVERPFLEIGEELWDRSGTRLTLLCDPGRVKRGLRPREEDGPILEEDRSYTLVVDAAWPDALGRPLRAPHRLTFRVGAPDATQPDPQGWALFLPAAGTRAPLVVHLAQPIDHALATRLVWIERNGSALDGRATLTPDGFEWRWTPSAPWQSGAHELVADTTLEDPSGNSIRAPFEVDTFGPPGGTAQATIARRAFTIDAAR